MVSLLDLAPTVMDLVGAPGGPAVEGRSLAAFLRGAGEPRANEVVPLQTSAHDGSVRLRGLRSPSHKLIVDDANGQRELYDLAGDPAERTRLPLPEGFGLARLLEGLRPRPSAAIGEPTPQEREVLDALGYQ
jgi:arylsulfatase A-like enzyme